MRGRQRTFAYLVIALITGASLAFAFALARGDESKVDMAAQVRAERATGGALYSDDGAVSTATDPAKQEPVLDMFTSKDPAFHASGTVPTPTPTSSTTSMTSSVTASTGAVAEVKVDGTSYSVAQGDSVPGGSAAAFQIASVTSSDVTFTVMDGSLKNGDSSVTVSLGEAADVTLKSGDAYGLSVATIGSSSAGTTTGSSGHTISLTSVSTQNVTPLAAFEVDGKTYSDKKVGDVFSTSYGEIEVLEIKADQQTVKIMHADVALSLTAGQVVVK